MRYIVQNTNRRLGAAFAREFDNEQVAWQYADELAESLWEGHRSFASLWDVNDLLRSIDLAVEVEIVEEFEEAIC